jgi:hypothetical protein
VVLSPQRIGVPLKSNGTPKEKTLKSLLALVFGRLETGAIDNFPQLGFVQLLVIVLDYGLALIGAHLCVFDAVGSFERFSNRCRALRTLHSRNLDGNGLGESCGCNHAEGQNQDTTHNKTSDPI